jgi:hypothetical protein
MSEKVFLLRFGKEKVNYFQDPMVWLFRGSDYLPTRLLTKTVTWLKISNLPHKTSAYFHDKNKI